MMRRTAVKRRPRNTGPDAFTVQQILERDSGCCVRCGIYLIGGTRMLDWSIHHRRRRDGKPDSHEPQNLVLMCGGDNVTGCHGWAHQRRSESQPAGYWLSRIVRVGEQEFGENPLLLPIVIYGSQWVYLTADGRYADNPPGGSDG